MEDVQQALTINKDLYSVNRRRQFKKSKAAPVRNLFRTVKQDFKSSGNV